MSAPFHAATMFGGDLYDAASRFASDLAARPAAQQTAAGRAAAWQEAVQMGWPAMIVAEELGGAGGTLADLGAVVEACARQASGLPLTGRCAVVPALLTAAGSDAAHRLLQGLALQQMDFDSCDASALQATITTSGGVQLDGTLQGLDLGVPATHQLIVVQDLLLLVPTEALPPATRHRGIDGSTVGDVTLQGLTLPAAAVIHRGPAVTAAAATAADLGALVVAIEMAATLGALIEHTIGYLQTRQQFGVALASFQALRHRVVELYVQYESASVLLARLTADVVASGRLPTRDASLAKLFVGDLARTGAEAAIQLHGGMGMTADLPAARLARRLLVAEFERGSRAHHLSRLQRLRSETRAAA